MLQQFESFEHQDRADLEYGGQIESCRRLAERDTGFEDQSITRDWVPDED